MVEVPAWLPLTEVGVVVAFLLALAVLRRIDGSRGWGQLRRSRFLLGVPWGTLVGLAGVLVVYLFLQGGHGHWNAPVTVAYRAWSYFYPLGVAVAPFAHGGPGHLLGNLTSGLVLGSIAEFAWGHYPTGRGDRSFDGARRNPYVRAFVLFPAGVAVVGLLTSLFSWGPVIGFSGVVFAFAGFAAVRYPLGAVIGLVVEDLASLVLAVLREPVLTAQAEPQFATPWWAGIAVQGHLLGLFLGILTGAIVLDRTERPPLRRLFVGVLLLASSFSLWVIWWYRGGDRYVLYRGIGVILVVAIALLVTLGLRERWRRGDRFVVPSRYVGILALVLPILVVFAVAAPLNLATVADPTPPGDGPAVEVGDYTVSYAENAPNQMVSVVDVSFLGETTSVRTSGVIVVSERRHVWSRELSAGRLAFAGRGQVVLGGPGWRETVDAARRGWDVTGNGTAYHVLLRPPEADWRVAYRSPPVVAEPVLDGRRVAVAPNASGFDLRLHRNGSTVAGAPLPGENESVALGGIDFVRENDSIVASYGETRVEVASRETYEG